MCFPNEPDELARIQREAQYIDSIITALNPRSPRARNAQLRQYAERSAINVPMQGTAADIIKRAMIGVLGESRTPAKMIMQVHDELVFEVENNVDSQHYDFERGAQASGV